MEKPPLQRVSYSPGEFAALFGKSQTWGYRQLYAGRVLAIREFGRILIPAVEVDRILETAKKYDGMKAEKSASTPEAKHKAPSANAWQKYLDALHSGSPPKDGATKKCPVPLREEAERRAAITRLTKRSKLRKA